MSTELEKKLLLAKKTRRIYDVIFRNDDTIKVVFNPKTIFFKRFSLLNHIQYKYNNIFASLDAENNLILRGVNKKDVNTTRTKS